MPIEHVVDVQKHLLRVRRWGDISTQDEAEACQARRADPLVVPGIPVLVDCTGVVPGDSTEVVKYLADCTSQVAADLQCGPVAIIVSSDVEYGMARMYMGYTDLTHPAVEVFRSVDDGLSWLQATNATA